VLVARKLMNLMFSHYTLETGKGSNLEISLDRSGSTKKTELYHGLKGHSIWKIPEFWEAAILESIQ
jgi:hypothetical protein